MSVPKPRLSFAVGVTGHRLARLESEALPHIKANVTRVFQTIEKACQTETQRHRGWYAAGKPLLRLVSNLADGADHLAVSALPECWSSAAILPKPRWEYLAALLGPSINDTHLPALPPEEAKNRFKAALDRCEDNIAELPVEVAEASDEAYKRASLLMLRQIDLLIAVWDGQEEGRVSSTSAVVKQALAWSIPVIWIASDGSHEPAHITKIGDVSRPLCDACAGPIEDIVKAALEPIDDPRRQRIERRGGSLLLQSSDRLEAFLGEKIPARYRWPIYTWLTLGPLFWKYPLSIPLSHEASTRKAWTTYFETMPQSTGIEDRIKTILLPRFAAADALASWYAHAYRSAYVSAYSLSVLAVLFALVGLILPHLLVLVGLVLPPNFLSLHHVLWAKLILVFLEFLFVLGIILIVWFGSSRKWHDRWLDYRALAETLRHLRILCLLGQFEPTRLAEASARPGSGWLVWYLRATMREVGTPIGVLDSAYQHHVIDAVEIAEIDGQIDYHDRNETTLERLHHWLHLSGDLCFFLTTVVLAFFALFLLTHIGSTEKDHDWILMIGGVFGFFACLLPTIGAALAGIRFTGDFEGFAQRSAETAEGLLQLKASFKAAREKLVFDDTAALLFDTVHLMANDLVGWRTLYGRKRLTLPA